MEAFGVGVLGEDTLGGLLWGAVPPTGDVGVRFPLMLLEEAFPSEPLAETPVFLDLAANQRLLAFFATQNQRSAQLDRPSVGSSDYTCDSREDRDLDATNPDSPYAPNITPNRRVRLRIVHDGVVHPIHEGFANKHNMRYAKPRDAFCDLNASDAFKILATTSLASMPARPKERADLRVTAILDWVGWPMSRRAISRARTILIAEDISDRKALEALLQIDDTECGRLTVDAAGNLVFLSRIDLFSAERQTVSQATFSDSGVAGTIPYDDPIVVDASETTIRNIVEITCPGKEPIVLVDEASREQYGPKSYQREVRDVTEAARRATAEHFLVEFKDMQKRVLGLTVNTSDYPPGFETGLYGQMARLRIGDRVTFEQHHPVGGEPFAQDCFIESKADSAAVEDKVWTTTLGLSYAPPFVSAGKWGSGQWGTAKWGW